MSATIDLGVTVDNTAGFSTITLDAGNRSRDGNIEFEYLDGAFRVSAWGPLFPEDGGGRYSGRLAMTLDEAYIAITHAREAWQRHVITYKVPADGGGSRFPFADAWDLSGDAAFLDQVGGLLARAGAKLFDLLFRADDDGLREIRDRLVTGVRSGARVLAFHSDDLFAPWPLLYVPPDRAIDFETQPDAPWSLDGFLGYGHLVEHLFQRVPFSSQIVVASQTTVGVNVDNRIDGSLGVPFVADVRTAVKKQATVAYRERRHELAAALKDPAFADHVMYFGCHGRVTSTGGGASNDAPQLALSDGEPIYADDVVNWLSGRTIPSNPVVFVNACQGGQMASQFYRSFGLELLKRGANCLLGPQIDLPPRFATEYATRVFERFLMSDQRLGDVVHDLTRTFADEHRNPLGLVFSLYRGLDTRLAFAKDLPT